MKREELFELLIYGRNMLISHYASSLIKLSILVIKEALIKDMSVGLFDERGTIVKYIPQELLQRATVYSNTSELPIGKDFLAILYLPGDGRALKGCKSENVLALVKPGQVAKLVNYTKHYLSRLTRNLYQLKCLNKGISVVFTFSTDDIEIIEKPPGIYGKAYEVLKTTMATYGTLTIKDAVLVLSKELGLEKRNARTILIHLARRQYIRVIKGRINLM
ncbi:MAG: hypothetical protein QXW94_01645 [Desulfurococcaceae archaeon]